MQSLQPVSVLVVPLDWGLGHATRCIPIIKELINQGVQVQIAASGPSMTLLKQEFPFLTFINIPGYDIRYTTGISIKWGIIFKIPKLLRQIKNENQWLSGLLETQKIDAVISDNRYGLYHNGVPSVFISHQLYIQSGFRKGSKKGKWRNWIDRGMMRAQYKRISRFSACWIPDEPGEFSIAGILSHPPVQAPIPSLFIGILSRFQSCQIPVIKKTLLIILSGPEPHRTILENKLFGQLINSGLKTILVRGLPAETSIAQIPGIDMYNHLPSDKLSQLMCESEFIITRAGYSTIMDLVSIRRSAILIPTPGQTEQEYLGDYLHEKNWMYTVSQEEFHLKETLSRFDRRRPVPPVLPKSNLHSVIAEFIQKLSDRKPAS